MLLQRTTVCCPIYQIEIISDKKNSYVYGFNERNELTRTQLTNIWLLSCMYPFMIFDLVLTTKVLAAIFTRKRFFSGVTANMSGQIFGMLCCKLAERTGMDFTFAFHQLHRNFCLVISSLDRGGLYFCHLFFSLLWSFILRLLF